MSKLEAVAAQRAKREYYLHGEGLYVYRNRTNGTLNLPKPTKSGLVEVAIGGEWEGDNYYMFLVRNNMAALVRTISDPVIQEVVLEPVVEESVITEGKENMQNKLILDQPECVTSEGKVEHVIVEPKNKTKEKVAKQKTSKFDENKEILLNDDPLDGVQILG
jgi:hypothetical protein